MAQNAGSSSGNNKTNKRLLGRNKTRFVTRSGEVVKVHRSLTEKSKARRDTRDRLKAERKAGMPKGLIKRAFFRLHPKRLAKYWFSREGLVMAFKLSGIGIVVMFLTLVLVFAYFRKDLPNLKDLTVSKNGGSVLYYDRTGKTLLWEDYDTFKRVPVSGDQISKNMKDAIVAIEDRDFYNHGGFNLKGIIRAGVNNARNSGDTQGASTITQQYIKLYQDWGEERTVSRKVKELILAVELERSYSKDEILAAYLNLAPFGAFETGVESAAQTYFHKSAKDLTLDEATFLAALPKSPIYLSPYCNECFEKQALLDRQHYIIDVMANERKITQQQKDEAKKVDILAKVQPRVQNKYNNIKAPYFVLTAQKELTEKYGSSKVAAAKGWKVLTTLDLNLQTIAEEEVNKGMTQVRRQGGDTAAFVAEDVQTGQVVAMVGGPDFNDDSRAGKVNFATQFMPPGSSFKPYDYASLMKNTNTSGAGSVIFDTQGPIIDPKTGTGYPCTNKSLPQNGGNCLFDFDRRYPGPLTIRYALGGSRNVPAVKAMVMAGIDNTINLAKDMGLRSGYHCWDVEQYAQGKKVDAQCYPSSAIGDGAFLRLDEHVHGYGTFSRLGTYLPQTYIYKIEDFKGKVINEWQPSPGQQVLSSDIAYIITDMLSDKKASYFAVKPHEYKGHKFALKTGTTNDAKDGWMMGYSPYYAIGVWVGNHTNQVNMTGAMENMTSPIWSGFMRRAHDNLQSKSWTKPASVKSLPAFVIRNHVGYGSVEPSPSVDLFPANYQAKAGQSQKRIIDTVTGKLATDCTPQLARKEVTEGSADTFSSDTLSGSSSDQKDDLHKCDDTKPSVSLDISEVSPGKYIFTANVSQGTHQLKNVTFSINGAAAANGSFDITGPGSVPYSYTATSSGTVKVTATVIDVALYDASVDTTASVSAAGGGSSGSGGFLMQSPDLKGEGKVKLDWSTYSGAANYEVCWSGTGNTDCAPTNNTSRTVGPLPAGTYTVFIKALDASNSEIARSDTQGFTIP